MIPLEPDAPGFGDRVHVHDSRPVAKVLAITAVFAALFAADLLAPTVPATTLLYVVPVVLAWRHSSRALPPAAFLATALVTAGFFWSTAHAAEGQAPVPGALATRLLAVVVVCGAGVVLATGWSN